MNDNGWDETQPTRFMILLPDTILFGFVLVLCFKEFLTSHKLVQIDGLHVSTGMEIRKWFHLVLFLAVFARFISLSAQFMFFGGKIVCPHTSQCLMTRTTPELLFLTLNSMLILFYAHLSTLAAGRNLFWLWPLFIALNFVYYAGYFVVLVFLYHDIEALATWTNYLFGMYYVSLMVFMFFYGPNVTGQILFSGNTPSGQPSVPNKVISRFVVVLMMYLIVMLARTAFFLGNAVDIFGWKDGSPVNMDPYLFDVLNISVCELLPACIVLYIMRKRKRRYVIETSKSPRPPVNESSRLTASLNI